MKTLTKAEMQTKLSQAERETHAATSIAQALINGCKPDAVASIKMPEDGGTYRLSLYRIWSMRDATEPSPHGGFLAVVCPGGFLTCHYFEEWHHAHQSRYSDIDRLFNDAAASLWYDRQRAYVMAQEPRAAA